MLKARLRTFPDLDSTASSGLRGTLHSSRRSPCPWLGSLLSFFDGVIRGAHMGLSSWKSLDDVLGLVLHFQVDDLDLVGP